MLKKRLPAAAIADFRESWEFQLSVQNVLDERCVEGADRSDASVQFGSLHACFFTVRRTIGGANL